MGILRDDPRLKPVMDALHQHKKKSFRSLIGGIETIKLDLNKFKRFMKSLITI